MDFSLPFTFVLPLSNTLPTTGSTEDLLPGQFGVYTSAYAVATTGNIAAEPYIYLAQGNALGGLPIPTKRSDKIGKTGIKKWYKVVAEPDVPVESVTISNFSVSCGEEVALTIRSFNNSIDMGFYNGLTRSATVMAPCCDCGDDPCTEIDPQALVDQLIAKFKQQNPVAMAYLDMYRSGTGTSSSIIIIGKPITRDGRLASDFSANPYEYDRTWFRAFVYKGADTTADFLVPERCDQVATVTVNVRALYEHGASGQIRAMEERNYSYSSPSLKHLFRNTGYNGAYTSNVVDGTFYDVYTLVFRPADEDNDWSDVLPQDATVNICVPTGQAATLQTLLQTYLGTAKDYSPAAQTTTTTTSTSSTTTTSTTIVQP